LDERNPYEPPLHIGTSSIPPGHTNRRAGTSTYGSWVFVFFVNLAVPLLFSSSMNQEHGRLGMFVAALLLLALGSCICAAGRKLAATLIAGGAIIGLTQLFPGLQLIAGVIGMTVGQALRLADIGDENRPARLISDYGGFVVTFVTGGILIATAACSGMLLRLITPARWWQRYNS
jgi:MFS family permease